MGVCFSARGRLSDSYVRHDMITACEQENGYLSQNYQGGYLERKYKDICKSLDAPMEIDQLSIFFSHLNLQKTIECLFSIMRGDQFDLDFETFKKQILSIQSKDDQKLSELVYSLFFNNLAEGLDQKFMSQFLFFLKVHSNLQTDRTDNTQGYQLSAILKKLKSKKDKKETCDWLQNNVDFEKLKSAILLGRIEADEKNVIKQYLQVFKKSIKKGEVAIVSTKWMQQFDSYANKKYSVNKKAINANSYIYQNELVLNEVKTNDKKLMLQPIDNYDLIRNNKLLLKDNIKWKDHYQIILLQIYEKLEVLLGGGPKIVSKMSNGLPQIRPQFIKIYSFDRKKEKKAKKKTSKRKLELMQTHMLSNQQKPQSVGWKSSGFYSDFGSPKSVIQKQKLKDVQDLGNSPNKTSLLRAVAEKEGANDFKHRMTENQGDSVKVGDVDKIKGARSDVFTCFSQNQDEKQSSVVLSQSTYIHWQSSMKETQPIRGKPVLTVSKRARAGISNMGNTCYMNAALQALFSLVANSHIFNKSKRFGSQLSQIYKKLQQSSRSTYPEDFKHLYDRMYPSFRGYEQHDAHEFLSNLLNELEEQNEQELKSQMECRIKSATRCCNCSHEISAQQSAKYLNMSLRNRDKKQVKIDHIVNNTTINTVTFEIDEQATVGAWKKAFEMASKAKSCYFCQVETFNFREFNDPSEDNSSFKSLGIGKHDKIYAYQIPPLFESQLHLSHKYKFYTLIRKDEVCVAQMQQPTPEDRQLLVFENRLSEELQEQVRIKIKGKTYFQTANVQARDLKPYPNPTTQRIMRVPMDNYIINRTQTVGPPFIFSMRSDYPLLALKQAIKEVLGNDKPQYFVRVSSIYSPDRCYICSRYYCDSSECFDSQSKDFPIQWYDGMAKFAIIWKSVDCYNRNIKKQQPSSNSRIKIEDMDDFKLSLDIFQKSEQVDLDCRNCGRQDQRMQHFDMVTYWPKLLIIQLSRFVFGGYSIRKIHTKWKLEEVIQVGNRTYTLKAVILHKGYSNESGHYVTVSEGYKYDDRMVTEFEYDRVDPREIYILMYST